MAYQGYIQAKGSKQGAYKGTSERTDHKDYQAVERIENEVLAPRDVIDGKAKGRRVHKPFKVLIEIDAAFPQWMSSLTQNELLTEVNIQLWDKDVTSGEDRQFFNIKLADAHVVSCRLFTGSVGDSSDQSSCATAKNAGEHDTKEYYEVGMSYRAITWEHKVGKTVVTDDWNLGKAT
jgi:type VI secretion system secreted protein Hcp